ncbi:uncharacterized protein LOC125025018 isoform X2 [Penaeus chinensis]|uniref:uncharacterized protein LOC125025018 isoform X2 n=1 Tax=Penaeus chinensis TaxID=139456 RepID=UPI001FB59DCA|nr:uncharacterized protein LOC125025018 isoform X2 [Penaeus chinensis]
MPTVLGQSPQTCDNVLVKGKMANILQLMSYVAKGVNMITGIQGIQREAARDNTHMDEVMEIIRKQQNNMEQLVHDKQQQEQVIERLLTLLEKMNENIGGSSAMNSNSMRNMSLVMNFPENSQDCSAIVQSLYWTLRNAMNHSQRSAVGGDPGMPLLQLPNGEDMTRSDSFVQDSSRSFEQISSIFQCDRCNNMFDKMKRQPIVLSGCGHTYCRICIWEERSHDRFMCPKCNIISRDLEELPINRTLYQLLDEEGRGEAQGPVPAGSRDSFAVGPPAEEEKERKAMLEQLRRIRGGESGGEEMPDGAVGVEGLSLKTLSVSDDEGGACGFSDDFYTDGSKEWTRKKLEAEEERDEEEQENKRQRRLRKRMIKIQRLEQEQLELAIALSESLQEAQATEKES